MPYVLSDLIVTRVDLVDEGANSAAFIELYKRKEQIPMDFNEVLGELTADAKTIVQAEIDKAKGEVTEATNKLTEANTKIDTLTTELAKAKEPLCNCDGEAIEGRCKSCGKLKKAAFDETEVLKSLPEAARTMLTKYRTDKESAETKLQEVEKAKKDAEAVAKAKALKSLPVEEAKLAEIIKSGSDSVLSLLTSLNESFEKGLLVEVGKSQANGAVNNIDNPLGKLEAKATEIAKSKNISYAKAFSEVVSENPALYDEYLKGGTN